MKGWGLLSCIALLAACSAAGGAASRDPVGDTAADPTPVDTTSADAAAPPPDASPADGAALRVSGCGKPAPAPGARTVAVRGVARTFHVVLPPAYAPSTPHPLVLVLHGATDTEPASMHDWFPVASAFSGPGAVAVYPQALPRTHADGTGGKVTRWDLDGDEDLRFVDALLVDIDAVTCLDRARVFATGFSSGGNFAHQLGCLRAATVRAIAPVAGPGPFEDSCASPMAVWMTHDANDEALAVGGARGSRDFWRATNGCKGTWQADPTNAACKRDVSCPPKTPLVYCETTGVGHDVPSFAAASVAAFFTALP